METTFPRSPVMSKRLGPNTMQGRTVQDPCSGPFLSRKAPKALNTEFAFLAPPQHHPIPTHPYRQRSHHQYIPRMTTPPPCLQ